MKRYVPAGLLFATSLALGAPQAHVPALTRWMNPEGRSRLAHAAPLDNGPLIVEFSRAAGRRMSGGAGATNRVCLLVASNLWTGLQEALAVWEADLRADGFDPFSCRFDSGSAESLRAFLKNYFEESASLAGSVLIGDIPHIIFEQSQSTNEGFDAYEDFPCDLFYMDMTGTWQDLTNTPPFSAGKYDTWGGDRALDIWVSRIKADNLYAFGAEEGSVLHYLEKNHDYRIRRLVPHRRALVYVDDDWCTVEASEDADNLSRLYGDVLVSSVIDPEATTSGDYLTNRLMENIEMVNVRSHGWPGGHGFYQSQRTQFSDVGCSDYRERTPRALFYSLFICSGCDYTASDYLGGTIAFNTNRSGLLCWGSTKTGGIWGDARFYDELVQGACVGSAFCRWFNQVSEWWPEYEAPWWRGLVLLGDASLRLNRTESAVTNVLLESAGPVSMWPAIPGGRYYFESAEGSSWAWTPAGSLFTATAFTVSFTNAGVVDCAFLRLVKDETPSGNLLTNFSFEMPGATNREARYWMGGKPDSLGDCWGNASRESWRAHSGEWEATVKGPWGGTGENFGGWWREIPVDPGQSLTASAWFWADTFWTAAVKELKIEFFSGSACLQTNAVTLQDVGESWTQKMVTGIAPPGSVKAHFTVNVEGSSSGGSVQFDDACLIP